MLEALILPPLNRLLRSNSAARERLRAHSGKVGLLRLAPFELRVQVSETGELLRAPGDSAADVTINAEPGTFVNAAVAGPHAWSAAQVTGDADFAAALDYVRRNLVWDYEEDLSRLFGDVAAHRIAAFARALRVSGQTAALNVGKSFAEYLVYERPLVASVQALEQFNRDVDVLRDDAARIEKRLELLERRERELGVKQSHSS